MLDILESESRWDNYENTVDVFFTATERTYCNDRLRCLGARYIIKKCVLDYLASERGSAPNNYTEIEVVNNELGQPLLKLFGAVRECVKELRIKELFISISHSKNWITGMVVFCY